MSEDYVKDILDYLFDYYANNLTKQGFLAYNIKIVKYAEDKWVIVKYTYDEMGLGREYFEFSSAYDLVVWLISYISITDEEYRYLTLNISDDLKLLRRI